MDENEILICARCKKIKTPEEFEKNRFKRSGFGCYCLECQREKKKSPKNKLKDGRKRSKWAKSLEKTTKCLSHLRNKLEAKFPNPTSITDRETFTFEELEFLKAVDKYKLENRRPFPTLREILKILKGLGYEKKEMNNVAEKSL